MTCRSREFAAGQGHSQHRATRVRAWRALSTPSKVSFEHCVDPTTPCHAHGSAAAYSTYSSPNTATGPSLSHRTCKHSASLQGPCTTGHRDTIARKVRLLATGPTATNPPTILILCGVTNRRSKTQQPVLLWNIPNIYSVFIW